MNDALVIIIGIGTGIAALAFLIQLALWFMLYRTGRRMQSAVASSMPKVNALKAVSKHVFADARSEARRMTASGKDVMTVAKKDLRLVNEVRRRATQVYRLEKDNARGVYDDAQRRLASTQRFVRRRFDGPARAIRRFAHRIERMVRHTREAA